MLSASPAYAAKSAQEAEIRAAILFNLVRFSQWPTLPETNSSDIFTICTLSNQAMEAAIDALAGKEIHGTPLTVLHLKPSNPSYKNCTVLYVSGDKVNEASNLQSISKEHVLTVGDSTDFLSQGGHMSIQRQNTKMKFSINLDAMKTIHVNPSSKILNLAVEPKP